MFVEEIHNGEFDYLIRGEQTSELSDVSSDYPDIEIVKIVATELNSPVCIE